MRERQYLSQSTTLEAPSLTEAPRSSMLSNPPFLVGVFVVIVLIAIIILGRNILELVAGPFLWIVVVLIAAIAVVVAVLCIVYAINTFDHKRQMLRLERELKEAEIERSRIASRKFDPDMAGNYAAYLHESGQFLQPAPGNVIQPVPQTLHYAPHITTHQQQQSLPEKVEDRTVSEITADFPKMEEIYDALKENALEVCLGRSASTGELFTMPLVEGTHYRIIGGSGFGKSCFAAAILDMTTAMNDEDHLQVALLDLEHKTSKLFEKLPHIAQIQVGRRYVDCVASDPDEVANHLGYLKKELDRRKTLSEYDLRRERFMLIYVEEFLSLKREVDPKLLKEMANDFTILAARGRKYGMYLLACAQVDYADVQFRDAMNQFNVNASFSVKPKAAQAVGFMSYDLLKQNFAAKQRGQFVLETTGCTDIMLAPQYDVKKMLLQLERSSYVPGTVQYPDIPMLNEPRTDPEQDVNDDERALALRSQVLYYHDTLNWGKQAIIEKIWNVKKGGSPRYKQAEAEYEAIMAEQEA